MRINIETIINNNNIQIYYQGPPSKFKDKISTIIKKVEKTGSEELNQLIEKYKDKDDAIKQCTGTNK